MSMRLVFASVLVPFGMVSLIAQEPATPDRNAKANQQVEPAEPIDAAPEPRDPVERALRAARARNRLPNSPTLFPRFAPITLVQGHPPPPARSVGHSIGTAKCHRRGSDGSTTRIAGGKRKHDNHWIRKQGPAVSLGRWHLGLYRILCAAFRNFRERQRVALGDWLCHYSAPDRRCGAAEFWQRRPTGCPGTSCTGG